MLRKRKVAVHLRWWAGGLGSRALQGLVAIVSGELNCGDQIRGGPAFPPLWVLGLELFILAFGAPSPGGLIMGGRDPSLGANWRNHRLTERMR